MQMHRHHLLEIILWPNGDGTFRKIINSKKRLKELGIYDDWKLTITIPVDEHSRMHCHNRSDATKRKMSAAKISNTNGKGYKHSEEAKAKISAARKGMKFTAEHRAKMSEAKKGEKNNMYGKQRSDDTKAKISAALKGRKPWNKGKKYEQS